MYLWACQGACCHHTCIVQYMYIMFLYIVHTDKTLLRVVFHEPPYDLHQQVIYLKFIFFGCSSLISIIAIAFSKAAPHTHSPQPPPHALKVSTSQINTLKKKKIFSISFSHFIPLTHMHMRTDSHTHTHIHTHTHTHTHMHMHKCPHAHTKPI